MEAPNLITIKGRGAAENPANRFEPIEYVPDMDEYDPDEPPPRTMVFRDTTKKIIARNNSPDVGFEFSINPYRGCEHGCIYCYARPTHEYFGLSAGLDFETKIFAKTDAAQLLRKELAAPKWNGDLIAISGVTDCYQPLERKFKITRSCLEVLLDFRNPTALITKNHLITRDVDILSEMAQYDGVGVSVSITSLRNEIQRVMEPRTSVPAKRLEAVEVLAKAGVPVAVMVAPVVPGLTDHEIPAILQAAKDAGARSAGYITLRLPWAVKELFERWLERHFPERKDKILNRVREMRDGKLYDPTFGVRMRGEGVFADQIEALFDTTVRKLGLNEKPSKLRRNSSAFRKPDTSAQLKLF
jgi:DNA repair photolyase